MSKGLKITLGIILVLVVIAIIGFSFLKTHTIISLTWMKT